VKRLVLVAIALCLTASSAMAEGAEIRVKSKEDTETTLLAHVIAHLLRQEGMQVDDAHLRFGGSPVVWKAICSGEIDMYVDYTGTLTNQIFSGQGIRNEEDLRHELAKFGIGMTKPLGFANNYAIGMQRRRAEELDIRRRPTFAVWIIGSPTKHSSPAPSTPRNFTRRMPRSAASTW
jgi:osmoprotectant transport system permease protein